MTFRIGIISDTHGLLRPDAGEIRLFGDRADGAARRRIGFLPEERGLAPTDRARDVIAFHARLKGLGRGEAFAAADRLLERLGLGGRGRERVEQLSKGAAQRVHASVALVDALGAQDRDRARAHDVRAKLRRPPGCRRLPGGHDFWIMSGSSSVEFGMGRRRSITKSTSAHTSFDWEKQVRPSTCFPAPRPASAKRPSPARKPKKCCW